MKHFTMRAVAAAVALSLYGTAGAAKTSTDAVYAPPGGKQLKAMTLKWVKAQRPSAAVQKQVDAIWKDNTGLTGRVGLQKVIETFAAVRPDARKFIESCLLVDAGIKAPNADILKKNSYGDFFTNNMRLYYGRYLAQRQMYEESLTVLSKIDPKSVVDPATALFYRAVCEHQMLQKKEALSTIAKLLKNTEQAPISYTNLATLMQDELQGLKGGVSLKKIALKMRNSDRHLKLARAGQNIQKLQGEIIADLDELIEKLEQSGGT